MITTVKVTLKDGISEKKYHVMRLTTLLPMQGERSIVASNIMKTPTGPAMTRMGIEIVAL